MITSLNIITPEYSNGFIKAIRKIRGDSIRDEIHKNESVTVRRVTYICRGVKIKPNKLYKSIGSEAVVLTDENARLPDGITRFCSNRFSQRLCVNTALSILKTCKNISTLKLGIYDPEAVEPDFLLEALRLCRSPAAVTYDLLPYDRIRRTALAELGASAVITRNSNELSKCDFIVAPTRISAYIPIKSDAVVLTVGEPYIKLSGKIYHKYSINLPKELEKLRPPELSAEYFGSALYSMCGFYRLGGITPICAYGNCGNFDKL